MPDGEMLQRSRLALQVGTVVVCAGIAASSFAGSGFDAAAVAQVVGYAPTRGVPGVSNHVLRVKVPGYSGVPLVCRRPNVECVPLLADGFVPIGYFLDTSTGALQLETRTAKGRYAATVVYAGVFQLQQAQHANALLIAKLTGALPRPCPRRPTRHQALHSQSSRVVKRTRRRLWSDGTGRFRATGRYGTATVRGTTWLIEERCAGTYVRVVRGTVDVRDLGRRSTVAVRAPHARLVRPRR